MSEEKEKGKGKDLIEKVEQVLSLRGIKGEDMAKMTVEELVKKEGLLPFNPLHSVSDAEAETLGAHAGILYGASIASIAQSLTRDDLPLNKRVNLGILGLRPLLAVAISAWETSKMLTDKEEEILGTRLLAGEVASGLGMEQEGKVTAAEVIAELREEVKLSKEEQEQLRKEIEDLKKKGKE